MLNCRMMKGFPSEALVVICDGSGCGVDGVGRKLKSRYRRHYSVLTMFAGFGMTRIMLYIEN